jgi:hypothetical protein
MGHNRSIGERVHDALVAAAEAQNEANRLRKLADSKLELALLASTGKNADERKAKAKQDREFVIADEKAFAAECAAVVAKAKAKGQEVQFEEWRTRQANTRAEMSLR